MYIWKGILKAGKGLIKFVVHIYAHTFTHNSKIRAYTYKRSFLNEPMTAIIGSKLNKMSDEISILRLDYYLQHQLARGNIVL